MLKLSWVGVSILFLTGLQGVVKCAIAPIEEAPIASHYWDQIYHWKDGSCDSMHKIRKTILKSEGIEAVSGLGLTYREQDRVRIIRAEVIQPDGKRISLKKKQIDVRLLAASAQGLSRSKQFSFLFPELKVGSTVELVWKCYSPAEWPGDQGGLYWSYPPGNERIDSLYAECVNERPWIWQAQQMEAFDIQASQDNKTLIIQLKQPRYYWFVNEPNGSYVRNYPRLAMNTTDKLSEVFPERIRAWNEILTAELPKPMAEAVNRVAGKSPEEQVIGLLRYIRDRYRYLGDWRSGKRGWLPFSLAEIAQRGYGDCKDLSVMLVAMLRASGITADPVVVARGLEAEPILVPSVLAINHTIVRAQMGEKIWWLDPTNPAFLPDYIPRDLHDRWAIRFRSDHQVELLQIPREDSSILGTREESTHDYNLEGSVHACTNTIMYRYLAIDWAAGDYYHGKESMDRLACGQDTKYCRIQRPKTDFLVPADYPVQNIRYFKKTTATPIGNESLIVNYNNLYPVATTFRYYLDNQGQCDLYMGSGSSRECRLKLKNFRLTKPVQPHHIQSPWLDYVLNWYNTRDGQDAIIELKLIYKVDWLTHATLTSPEFKGVLEKLEAASKDLTQVVKIVDLKKAPKSPE